MKRTVSKWLSILSCTALLCTSIPAAFAEGTVEESLVPVTGAQTGFVLSQGKYYTDFANLAQERAAAKALNFRWVKRALCCSRMTVCCRWIVRRRRCPCSVSVLPTS